MGGEDKWTSKRSIDLEEERREEEGWRRGVKDKRKKVSTQTGGQANKPS